MVEPRLPGAGFGQCGAQTAQQFAAFGFLPFWHGSVPGYSRRGGEPAPWFVRAQADREREGGRQGHAGVVRDSSQTMAGCLSKGRVMLPKVAWDRVGEACSGRYILVAEM